MLADMTGADLQYLQQKKQKDPSNPNAGDTTSGQGVVPEGDRVIPNAGVYGQQQANAELAYQNAVAQAQSKKNSLYHQYGLTSTGQVDPMNQYGQYQQMLQTQGSDLDSVRDNAMERGLGGGPGLGNQAERGLRYANGVANLGFQGAVNQVGTDYGLALGDAEVSKRNAMTQALQDALQGAWGDWTPPDMTGDTYGPQTGAPELPALKALKKATVPKKKVVVKSSLGKIGTKKSPYTAAGPGGPKYKPKPKKKK